MLEKARSFGNWYSSKEIELKLRLLTWLGQRQLTLTKIGVVAGLLLLVSAVGGALGGMSMRIGLVLAGLPFAIFFVLWVQEKIFLVPGIILFSAAFVPIAFPTGTGSSLVISLVFAAGLPVLWLLRRLLVDRGFDFVPMPFYGPVIGFSVVTVVSLFWSMIFRDPLVFIPRSFFVVQMASAVIMVVSPCLLLVMGNLAREEKHLKWLVWIMLALGLAGSIRNYLSIELPANTMGLASMWIVGLATATALFNEKLSKEVRGMCLALAASWVYWDFVGNLSWIAGWLPGFVMLGVVLSLRSKRLLALAGLAVLVYVLTHWGTFEAWIGDESVTSGGTRLLAWETNWRYTKDHLLFGMGPAGYAVYYMTYNPLDAMATHNNYIDLISQTGLLGTTFYLAIFGLLLWRGWKVYQRVQGRRNFQEALVVACLGGTCGCLVIMAFGDWLLPFAYTQTISGFNYSVYNWLFMGAIVSLDVMTRPQEPVTG